MLGNYTHWVEHIGLSGAHAPLGGVFTTIGSLTASKWDTTGLFAFATAEEEQRWLCTAQLHQLVLWQVCRRPARCTWVHVGLARGPRAGWG